MVSNVSNHQPVLEELVQEGRQLTNRPAIADEAGDVERRWNIVRIELERCTIMLETAVCRWTQYVHLVNHLRQHLSNISVKLQSDIRPNMCSADLTSLAKVLQMNQVNYYFYFIFLGLLVYICDFLKYSGENITACVERLV